jgi:hypothetical protein
VNFSTGALVHLQLGRAYAISGDTARAKAAYQEFLTLWKEADPHIPILSQSRVRKAEVNPGAALELSAWFVARMPPARSRR